MFRSTQNPIRNSFSNPNSYGPFDLESTVRWIHSRAPESDRASRRLGSAQPTRVCVRPRRFVASADGWAPLVSTVVADAPLKPSSAGAHASVPRSPSKPPQASPPVREASPGLYLPGGPFQSPFFSLSCPQIPFSSPRLLRRRRFKSGRLRPTPATLSCVGCSWSSGAAVAHLPGAPRRLWRLLREARSFVSASGRREPNSGDHWTPRLRH